jgi:tripartite-type tricarboxylate transporter receptor subunit TctC
MLEIVRARSIAVAVASVCALLPASAVAQSYPAKPLRIVVGFAPGGAVDIAARAVGKSLSEAVGQTVIVDNRPGAAGNIGAALVAKSPPDGYALLMANSTISTPGLFVNMPFDVLKDLEPVTLVAIGPSVLVAHPSFPVRTVKDLIALARARPGEISYGSGGIGNITHLEMELVKSLTGVRMEHVPYKGAAPSIVGLVSGEVQVLFSSIPAALGQVRAGKMRALAVSTLRRSSALPDVPTIDESALKGYDAASWYGLFMPAGAPKNAVAAIAKEVVKIMQAPEIRQRFMADGFEPAALSPDEFSRYLREEIRKWDKIVKAAGIKPQ